MVLAVIPIIAGPAAVNTSGGVSGDGRGVRAPPPEPEEREDTGALSGWGCSCSCSGIGCGIGAGAGAGAGGARRMSMERGEVVSWWWYDGGAWEPVIARAACCPCLLWWWIWGWFGWRVALSVWDVTDGRAYLLVQGLEEEERCLELVVHVRLCGFIRMSMLVYIRSPPLHPHPPIPTHLPPPGLGLDAAEPVDLALQPPHVLLVLVLLLELPPLEGQLLLLVLVLLLRLLGCVWVIRYMRRKYTTHHTNHHQATTHTRTHHSARRPASGCCTPPRTMSRPRRTPPPD